MQGHDRLIHLLDYLAQDPRNPTLLSDVAEEQLRAGDWTSACASLHQLIAMQPGHPQHLYRLAVAERHADRAPQAIILLNDLIKDGHAHPVVMLELARCRAQQGQWAQVCPTLQNIDAATLPTEERDAIRLIRVRALHHVGDMDAARREAEAWQADCGGKLPTAGLAAMATLLLDQGLIDDATRWLDAIDPTLCSRNAELAAAAGFVALSQGQAGRARQWFECSALNTPGSSRAHLGMGLAMAAQGRLADAIHVLRDAIALEPNHLGSWHALAWMQLLSSDVEGASASFQAALALNDNFGESHGGVALIAALMGERTVSERHMRTALRLDPDSRNAILAAAILERRADTLDPSLLAQALGPAMGQFAKANPALMVLLTRHFGRQN